MKSLNRAKPNSERWKRQPAGRKTGPSCCSGKTRHGSSNSVSHILFTFHFCLFTLLSGCSETFEPLKERDTHPFSIFGYLDASLETNWVRISEVRSTLVTERDDTLDAVVKLEHLESGQTEVLKDSLVWYRAEEVFAHNFRVSMQIMPEQKYHLKAERSDGQVSSVSVTLPDTFPAPEVFRTSSGLFTFHLENIEKLADIRIIIHHDGNRHVFPVRHAARRLGEKEWFVNINMLSQLRNIFDGNIPPNYHSEVYIASAGPDWIDIDDLDSLIIELPETTNVKNGTGYLIGILSKTVTVM